MVTASHDSRCIVNARSAFDFGASAPARAYGSSLISSGFEPLSQRVE